MNIGKGARWGFLLLTVALPFWVTGLLERSPALSAEGSAELTAPTVALTFDDGPRRSTTLPLLDGLAERGVHATFFLVGELLEGNEDIVEKMGEEGHQVGIHTYHHVWLTELNSADFAREVTATQTALEEILGAGSYWLRPPYGGVDEGVKTRAEVPIVLWSVDPEDWRDRDTERIVSHIVQNARDGDIILLHDIYAASVEAALQVVDELHRAGFLFVTVEELAESHGITPRAGEVYRSFAD